jgi:ribosomal protein S18 acetylase RimI-like enzyme
VDVRPATPDDAPAVAEVHVRSWQVAYVGLVPQDHLDRLDPADRLPVWRQILTEDVPPAGTAVLVDGDRVVGFVRVGPGRPQGDIDPAAVGELATIYILGSHWGRGGGRLLMADAVGRLTRAGFREAVLWVLETNVRARRFYEKAGWYADGATDVVEKHGWTRTEVRYRRSLSTVD